MAAARADGDEAVKNAKDAAEKSEGRRRPVSMDDPAIVRFTKEAGLSSDEVKGWALRWVGGGVGEKQIANEIARFWCMVFGGALLVFCDWRCAL